MNSRSSAPDNSTAASPADAWLLYSGIKSLLRCDDAEVVQGIARYVVKQYRSLRIGAEFVENNRNTFVPPLAAFLGAITRFLEVRESDEKNGAIWVARLANERRTLEKIITLLPETLWTEIKLQRPPKLRGVFAVPRRIFPLRRRIFRLVRHLLRDGHQFFKILRAVEMIGYYAAYLHIFRKSDYRAALMSSHSNPHGIAFNLAARRCGIPTVLVTHGMPVRPVARLTYDLGIVHCEAARGIYAEEGCRFKEIFIHGRKQDFVPMLTVPLPDKLTVGVFLCKDVNESAFHTLVARLLENARVRRILIRPHPKNLYLDLNDWISSLNEPRVQQNYGDFIFDDLAETDIVFGGNSSVLIEAVTAGRPSVYVKNLDCGAPDFHDFVANKLIYPFEAESEFDFDKIKAFYLRDDWLNVLRFYANVDEYEKDVNQRASAAISKLNKEKRGN